MSDLKQLSVPTSKVGQTQGALGTYRPAPSMDKNHVMQEKGVGEVVQLGFNAKLGIK